MLGTATLSGGRVSLTVPLLGGTRSLTAVYSGDITYSGSSSATVTQTVNLPATTTALTGSVASSYAGKPVTFTAHVSGAGAPPSGSVTFFDGAFTIGSTTLTAGQAGITTGALAVGAHNITAAYSGDTANAAGSSTTVSVTVSGPNYSLLNAFTGGADGGAPQAGVTQGSDGAFYGVTDLQSTGTYGTIFRFAPIGGLTTLHTFVAADGGLSRSRLLVGADGLLYGTSASSASNSGTVWRISTQGSFSVLYAFNGNDGRDPAGGLVQDSAGTFYGMTISGGQYGCGILFALTPAGALTTLHSFTCGADGNGPAGALVFGPDGNLYGVTQLGGTRNAGTVFRATTAGTLTTLYSFAGSTDGWLPQAGLMLGADGIFYGTSSGGATGRGTIFKITAAGVLTTLYGLSQGDGSEPLSSLVQDSKGTLYGEAFFTDPGFAGGNGTLFELTPDGTFVRLRAMNFPTGIGPAGGLTIAQDGNLYGTDDQGGASGLGGIFSLALPGPLVLIPATLSNLSEGADSGMTLAQVSGGAPPYTVSVNWGDGSSTSANVTDNGAVTGTHTWSEESPSASPYTLSVTVSDSIGQTATVTETAAVADAAINSSTPGAQNATVGISWAGTLETFTDIDPGGVVGDYTASIDWGDGTVQGGTIGGTNPFSVSGTHTFTTPGQRAVTVTFTDAGGASGSVVISFTVVDVPLSGSAAAVHSNENGMFKGTVATFSDANGGTLSNFTATIAWGDGSISSGTLSGNGPFTVKGSHSYREGGTYATSVTINDSDGSTLTVSGNATVSDFGLSATGVNASGKKSFSNAVASLKDMDPTSTAAEFTVTINWGDGTSSAGTVRGTRSPFSVSGSHTYGAAGKYTVTISVRDAGGATAAATSTLTIR